MQKKNQQQSIDITQMHPYEYLKQLNSIYNFCNKANAKSYSSVSKIKLAWKPFSIMKIPNCFQVTYQNSHKNDKHSKCESGQVMQEGEKKIWKDHQEIMRRYTKNKDRKTQMVRPQSSAKSNRTIVQTNILNDQSNQLLKKLKQRGLNVRYDKQQVIYEVVQKLKKLQKPKRKKQVWRAQSAINHTRKQVESSINQKKSKNKGQLYLIQKPYSAKERRNINENQFLTFYKNSQIIEKYQQKIKQVDCAISEMNIKKTNKLLRNMQNIIQRL